MPILLYYLWNNALIYDVIVFQLLQIIRINVAITIMAKQRDEELESEFDYTEGKRRKTWNDDPISHQRVLGYAPTHSATLPSKELVTQERDKEEWRARKFHLLSLDAYSRHKALVNHYLLSSGRGIEHFVRSTEGDRNDYGVLVEHHRFLWDERDDTGSWEKSLAKSYYDRLFKEYAISDLSRYKENKIALRWRTEKEVVEGKGQFVCGNKPCVVMEGLESWEVNFGYMEEGEKKNALVKLRLCAECSRKLNYCHKKKRWKKDSKHSSSEKDRKRKGRRSSKEVAGDMGSTSSVTVDKHVEEKRPESEDPSVVWSKPAEALVEKSKDEEFDEYFKDMLL